MPDSSVFAHAREDLSLKPNQRLVVVHPTAGFLPFHVETREPYYHRYDRLLTEAGVTQIAANGTIASTQLFDSRGRDEIEVNKRDHVYHLFVGLTPPALKLFPEFPKGTAQRVPDNQNFLNTAKYGYVDGWQSPYDDPSPRGEVALLWGRDTTGWVFHNPLTLPITQPFLKFEGYKYQVKVIRNVDLVQAMLEERPGAAARKLPLGWGINRYTYDPREPYDVDWIPYVWTRQDIADALTTRREVV